MVRQRSFAGRFARFAVRYRRCVLGVWLAIIVVVGMAASGRGRTPSTEPADFSESDAARALALVEGRFGDRPVVGALVIRGEAAMADDGDFRAFVRDLSRRLAAMPGVAGVLTHLDVPHPTLASADRHAVLVQVAMAGGRAEATAVIPVVLAIVDRAAGHGYALHLTGAAPAHRAFNAIAKDDRDMGERPGVPVARGPAAGP